MKPEDFDKLRYNVYNLPQDRFVLAKWPELNIPVFNPPSTIEASSKKGGEEITQRPFRKLAIDKVLRYIFVLYDRNSPLHLLPTLFQQKTEAARIAGFTPSEDGKWEADIIRLFRGELTAAVDAILHFSRMQHPQKWSTYVTLTLRHYNDEELMIKSPKEAPSTKVFMENTEIIEKLRDELIFHDVVLQESFEVTIMDELGLRPEEIGKKILDGDRVVDLSPYK